MARNFVLTLVDTLQIQKFIFGSNKLREIVGASHLLKQATEDLLVKTIYQVCEVPMPSTVFELKSILNSQTLFEQGAKFEIIYCGGGNAKILFQNKDDTIRVIEEWSRQLLDIAPGLQIAVHHKSGTWDEAMNFVDFIDEAERELAQKKASYVNHDGNLAAPFVVRCSSTGLPASRHDSKRDNARLSEQAFLKRETADNSFQDWLNSDALKKNGEPFYTFPLELDQLGQREGLNYIGIIHADGNQMGKKVKTIAQTFKKPREYIDNIRKFSIMLDDANKNAFKDVLKWITSNLDKWYQKNILRAHKIKLRNGEKRQALPVRPIIMGGDDFTAITPGVLALQISQKFQEAFKEHTQQLGQEFEFSAITASSGVAIVHSHLPFDRAYELAESLASSAKKVHRGREESWIDWYVATDSELAEIEDLRRKKYTRRYDDLEITLTMKPYRIDDRDNRSIRFKDVIKDILELRNKENFPRSKLKQLLTAIAEGPQAGRSILKEMKYHLTKTQYKKLEVVLYRYHNSEDVFQRNNSHLATALFDLIETLEFIVQD